MKYETFYRAEWMSDEQWECACLIADVFGGFHHLKVRRNRGKLWIFEAAGPDGIRYLDQRSMATYDAPELTHLVVLAHGRCIRVEIAPRMNRLEIMAHKREGRDGRLWQRHPTIADAVERFSPMRTEKSDG